MDQNTHSTLGYNTILLLLKYAVKDDQPVLRWARQYGTGFTRASLFAHVNHSSGAV